MLREITLVFFLGFLAIGGPASRAETEIPNPGPRSIEEAGFLFKEGQHALATRDFPQALRSFSRMIERYPSDARVNDAYLGVLEACRGAALPEELLRFGKELILRKPSDESANEARLLMAGAELELKGFLAARTLAGEVLQHEPSATTRQRAHAIRFQSHLEDKQFDEAEREFNLLRDLLEKNPNESLSKRIPSFRMSLLTRGCLISHLLKDSKAGEDELLEYFSKKNLCFKTALPESTAQTDPAVIGTWCEEFTAFDHELRKLGADPSLKEKIGSDLSKTLEFAKTLNPELVKCYAPYSPKKPKKSRRRGHRPKS